MIQTRIWRHFMLAAFVTSVAAAEAAPPNPETSLTEEKSQGLVSLSIFPEQISLSARAVQHQVRVSGLFDDGWEEDLTAKASFGSSQPAVVEVSPAGQIRGIQAGEAIIQAQVNGRTVSVPVRITSAPRPPQISFINEVLPILSKAGCNSGSCHAKPGGQNGFKLSVFAYDPKSDYQEIVQASRGRRVFPAFPAESLLLKKPTMALNHGGGKRLDPGSPAYRTLNDWIQQGLPFAPPGEPKLDKIQVYPAERRYRPGGTQPLLVQALYSDGTVRDVTSLAEYRTNDKEFARVDDDGIVTVGPLTGEGVMVVRFMGLVGLSRITVPTRQRLPDSVYAALPVHTEIDRLVYARLQKLGLTPSDECSDSEFLRRASLDAIGRLPAPEQAEQFLASRDHDKRIRLIDELLQHQAYADHWAVKWGDLLRPNPFRVGVKSVFLLDQWLRESFRQNRPYDQMVRELLTAQGSTHRYGPAVLFRDRREPAEAAAFVSQIFLGVRLECAKCHHHPNEKWSQADYYQLAAFFGQVKRKGQGISAPISGEPEFIWFAPGGEVRHPVSGEVMKPTPPDGLPPEIKPGQDPRQALAEWVTQPDNPFFARAVVNRVWAEVMGHGIVEPVDDFRASNPPSNEPLLNELAHYFEGHGYDLKQLLRHLMRSRVYQLSSLPNETNLSDSKNFSRFYRRRIPAELLLDAVSDVTGVPDQFQGLAAGSRAIETWNHRLESEFMDAFGRPNSSAECPCERDRQTSIVQALHLMNSTQLQGKLAHPEGRAARFAKSSLPPEAVVREIYLAAYSRPPGPDELSIATALFDRKDVTRQTAAEDILWSLINSAEFVFNH